LEQTLNSIHFYRPAAKMREPLPAAVADAGPLCNNNRRRQAIEENN